MSRRSPPGCGPSSSGSTSPRGCADRRRRAPPTSATTQVRTAIKLIGSRSSRDTRIWTSVGDRMSGNRVVTSGRRRADELLFLESARFGCTDGRPRIVGHEQDRLFEDLDAARRAGWGGTACCASRSPVGSSATIRVGSVARGPGDADCAAAGLPESWPGRCRIRSVSRLEIERWGRHLPFPFRARHRQQWRGNSTFLPSTPAANGRTGRRSRCCKQFARE